MRFERSVRATRTQFGACIVMRSGATSRPARRSASRARQGGRFARCPGGWTCHRSCGVFSGDHRGRRRCSRARVGAGRCAPAISAARHRLGSHSRSIAPLHVRRLRPRRAGWRAAVLRAVWIRAARLHGLDNEYGVDEEFMVLELRERVARTRPRSRSVCAGVCGSVKVSG